MNPVVRYLILLCVDNLTVLAEDRSKLLITTLMDIPEDTWRLFDANSDVNLADVTL